MREQRRRSRARVRRLVISLVPFAACTELSGTDSLHHEDGALRIVETIPAAGATEVAPDTRIDYCFSTLVDPRSVDDFDAVFSSGAVNIDVDAELQLFPWRPAADGAGLAEEAWCAGSVLSVHPKQGALDAGLLFRVRLWPSLNGWGGEALATDTPGWMVDVDGEVVHYTEFTIAEEVDDATDSGSDDEPQPPIGPTLRELFAADEVFDPALARCGCHGDAEVAGAGGLDMSTPERAYEGLVLRSTIMSTGFPLVSPRRPSESYLVHKLLRDGDAAIHGVIGDPMPPAQPLAFVEMAAIAAWIEAGAELE